MTDENTRLPSDSVVEAAEAIQEIIDRYAIAGANLLQWITPKDEQNMPRPHHRVAGLPIFPPSTREWRDWASDVACRAAFQALREAKDAVKALAAQPRDDVVILRGVGKKSGDGWKDSTRKGEVVFVWNDELPEPHAAGQYPRISCEGWSASTEQYDFSPAVKADLPAIRQALAQTDDQPRDDVRDAWSRCELIAYSHQQSDLKVRVANSADMTTLVTALSQGDEQPDTAYRIPSLSDRERIFANEPYVPPCTVPPKGWRCTRKPGHEGPCAAIPETDRIDTQPDTDGLAGEAIRILDRAIDFRAYHHADPCAIRFGFAKDDDRIAAANALDRVFSALTEEAGK